MLNVNQNEKLERKSSHEELHKEKQKYKVSV